MTDEMTETEYEADVVMQKFGEIKKKYIELRTSNAHLEEAIELLQERLKKKEQQRYDLISMLKKVMNESKEKIESLQKENNYLHTTIQDQNQTITEYSNTIDELRKNVDTAPEENTTEIIENQIDFNFTTITKNINYKLGCVDNKNNYNTNPNNFTHPSFDNGVTIISKSQKSSRVVSQFRWPNLDVVITGGKKTDKNMSQINSQLSETRNENKLFKTEKRRKLYIPDDTMVDLENEENNI